jgi:condensin complex subunit 3
MVGDPSLPAELIPACLDMLLKLSNGEPDFMRVVVEIVQWIREDAQVSGNVTTTTSSKMHDKIDEEDEDEDEEAAYDPNKPANGPEIGFNPPTLDAEKAAVHLRCLAIVRGLFERVLGVIIFRVVSLEAEGNSDSHTPSLSLQALRDNAALNGLVHELIVPSVRSKEPQIREQGLICLGLCSLLDKVRVIFILRGSSPDHPPFCRTWLWTPLGCLYISRRRQRRNSKSRCFKSSSISLCSMVSVSSHPRDTGYVHNFRYHATLVGHVF